MWKSIWNWFSFLSIKILKVGPVPKHVAFIMDGNRRYAKDKNILKLKGYKKGVNQLMEILNCGIDFGISEMTVYSFSIENFKRSKEEVHDLMQLTKQQFEDFLENIDMLTKHGIRIRVIGNLSLIPKDLRKLIAKVMVETKNNNIMSINFAHCYTSRDEITNAIKDIMKDVKRKEILPEDINEDLISKCLYTYGSSNPDLLIHTSGENRLSDFLMWQISETCIYFTNVLWPDFSIWHFFCAIFYYQRCYPDLQKITRMQNPKSVMHDRISRYVNKLHHERQVMLENICL